MEFDVLVIIWCRKFIRTKDEIEAKRIEQLLHDSIMEIVKKRQNEVETGQANSLGNDFLGSLLKVYNDMDQKNSVSAAEIIDECKTFYFAGQETTYSLLSWATLLLAIHTDWQEKARIEVLQFFGQENPNTEGIARLKTVSKLPKTRGNGFFSLHSYFDFSSLRENRNVNFNCSTF